MEILSFGVLIEYIYKIISIERAKIDRNAFLLNKLKS